MKKILLVISVIFTLLVVAVLPINGRAQVLPGSCGHNIEVVASTAVTFGLYPSDPYTGIHGLAFDGQSLWAAHYGGGKIYELAFYSSGEMVPPDEMDYIDAPSNNPTGITFVGKNLFAGDDGTLEISKIKTTGNKAGDVKSSFICPGEDCVGLTYDGNYLWNADFNWSDSNEAFIHKLQMNGKLIATYVSPGLCPEGLAFDGEFLWHVEYCGNKIYKLNVDGTQVCSWDWLGENPIGLTFDGVYLWLSDAGTGRIYKIDIGR